MRPTGLAGVRVAGWLAFWFRGVALRLHGIERFFVFFFVPFRRDVQVKAVFAVPATERRPVELFHDGVQKSPMLGATHVSPEAPRTALHVFSFVFHAQTFVALAHDRPIYAELSTIVP